MNTCLHGKSVASRGRPSDSRLRDIAASARPADDPVRKARQTSYFGDVDTKAPLYKPGMNKGNQDVTKRSKDRWESDFIWNTNWQDTLDQQAAEAEAKKKPKPEAESEGFLSFSRVADLNDMNIDLSRQLKAKRPPPKKAPSIQMNPVKRSTRRYNDPPTPGEAKKWQRSSGYLQRASASMSQAEADEDEAVRAQREADEARYEELKREYSLWTSGTVFACCVAVYAFYSRDTTASYLMGALGGLLYLRLLNRSVDSVGGSTLADAAGGALGQPRLLIPVILVLVYNRYNLLYADSMHLRLELLPMLAGFFTYKAGVLGRGSLSLARELLGKEDTSTMPGARAKVDKQFDADMLKN